MKLSFECNLDPKSLPTKNGKKFCDKCQHHVIDLRRKSDEKITLFLENNIEPCVIIHQEQLDRLPKKKRALSYNDMRYFPYAASIITFAFLPTLIIAQSEANPTVQVVGHTPIPFLDAKEKISSTTTSDTKNVTDQKYTLSGRVKLRDKKYKIKNGKGVFISYKTYDSTGKYMGRDTVVAAKLKVNGTFKLSLTKKEFELIQHFKDELYIDVDVFRIERIEELTFYENSINIIISTSGKKRSAFMGRLAYASF